MWGSYPELLVFEDQEPGTVTTPALLQGFQDPRAPSWPPVERGARRQHCHVAGCVDREHPELLQVHHTEPQLQAEGESMTLRGSSVPWRTYQAVPSVLFQGSRRGTVFSLLVQPVAIIRDQPADAESSWAR